MVEIRPRLLAFALMNMKGGGKEGASQPAQGRVLVRMDGAASLFPS